jgi:hypothetical protein
VRPSVQAPLLPKKKKTKKQKNIPLRFLQTEEHKRDPKNANIQTFCQTLNDLSKLSELNILPF